MAHSVKAVRTGVHVGINAHLLSSAASYRSAGVSNYSRHLLTALGRLVAEGAVPHRFTAFLHAPDFAAAGIEAQRGSQQLEQPLLRIAWEQSVLPVALAHIQADVVHGLVNVLPLATQRPGVVTVHDLSFLRLPELFPPFKNRAYLTALCRASVARPRQIVAVSRQTADDLALAWGVDGERVLVAPNGDDQRFSPGTPAQAIRFRQQRALPERYWFIWDVGATQESICAAECLCSLAASGPNTRFKRVAAILVLAGGKSWITTPSLPKWRHWG